MLRRVAAAPGPVGVLVDNAGIAIRRDAPGTLTAAEFGRTLAVNLKSAFLRTRPCRWWPATPA